MDRCNLFRPIDVTRAVLVGNGQVCPSDKRVSVRIRNREVGERRLCDINVKLFVAEKELANNYTLRIIMTPRERKKKASCCRVNCEKK